MSLKQANLKGLCKEESAQLLEKLERRRLRHRRWDIITTVVGVLTILAVSLGFGFYLSPDPSLPTDFNYARISAIVGWCYFACWSISFYPQVYQNWKRASVVGLSFDFGVYNFLGFGCYAIFNSAFFWSKTVQAAYAELHDGHASAVQANDVFFSLHAVALTLLALLQCVVYERGGQRVSEVCKIMTATAVLAGTGYAIYVSIESHLCSCFAGLAWLYLLSYIKLAVTVFKYIPQVMLNYKRKSTVGWSIQNVLLDSTGGLLSLAQILGDSYMKNDWTTITGDPVKFGLGFTSLVFDAIFMVQHYILYPGNEDHSQDLLSASSSEAGDDAVKEADVEAGAVGGAGEQETEDEKAAVREKEAAEKAAAAAAPKLKSSTDELREPLLPK